MINQFYLKNHAPKLLYRIQYHGPLSLGPFSYVKVLSLAREGAWEGGAGGGAAAPVGADPTDPGQPAGDASGR